MLTDAGRRLLPYAQEISKMHAMAKDALCSETELTGTLKIGAPESLAAFRLPELIREYRERYSKVKMVLKPGECWELRDMVRSGGLKDETILNTESGCTYRIRFEQYLNRHGIFADPSLEFWKN
jgi:hypothetical protein